MTLEFESRPQGFAGLRLNHLATSRYWCARRDLNPHALWTQRPQRCESTSSTTRAYWWAGEVSNLHHLVLQTSATDRISYLPIIGTLIMRASQRPSALLNDFLVFGVLPGLAHCRFYVRSAIRTSTSLTKVVPRVGFEPTTYGI